MELKVDPESVAWFKEEVGLPQGAGVRFLVKVYGCSPINSGFSLAMETNYPSEPGVTYEADGVLFYIESRDEWFFDGHDLSVEFDEGHGEPAYIFVKDGVAVNPLVKEA
ncbi:iron-sulfur cluster biosynthesis protein [Abiotrophia defectiva]|uniref:HesB/YadR/YfhF family protein n=1 Tax=Abiotrophia defectiva TaxID=46125 RepID=UPI0028D0E236|nr:iron-sulfur cluster biosynthesis protein [Abiotrophia defectiva]